MEGVDRLALFFLELEAHKEQGCCKGSFIYRALLQSKLANFVIVNHTLPSFTVKEIQEIVHTHNLCEPGEWL